MAQQIVFFDDSNPNAATTIAGMRADFDKYGIDCRDSINVSGMATFTGTITDNNEQVGAAGSVLSSTGTGVRWIPAGEGNTASASNVGTNVDATDAEQWLTFVGSNTLNNPIRVDDDLRYNPSTNTLTAENLVSTSNVGIGSTQPEKELDLLDETNQVDIRLKTTANSFNSFIFDSNRNKELQYALIDGNWDGTTVNRIRFVTGSNDTNKDDGWMAFHTKETGQNLTEILRIVPKGITVTGICSATSFKGPADGTAAVYFGDGSNLTGIDSYNDFTTSTTNDSGTRGTVPAPPAGAHVSSFLKADGSWHVPSYTTLPGAPTTSAAGLVPQLPTDGATPPNHITNKFLKSDGTWDNLQVKSDWNQATTTDLSFIDNKPDVLKFKSFKIRVTATTPGTEGSDFNTIEADANEDTFEIVQGSNVSLTADTSNKKLTIAAANDNTTYSIATADNSGDVDINLTDNATTPLTDTITVTAGANTTLTHETNGNGFEIASSDTTYDAPTTTVPGLVPVLPTDGNNANITTQVLKSDGNWGTDNNTWRGIDTTPEDNDTDSISSSWALSHNAATGNGAHVPTQGYVHSVTVNAAGSGYAVNDVITISGGTGATFKVNSVNDPGGAVATISALLTSGSGYSATGTDVSTSVSPTGGTGLKVNYTAKGHTGEFLKYDGTWATPSYTTNTNTTYDLEGGGTDATSSFGTGTGTINLKTNNSVQDTITVTAGSNIKIVKTGSDFTGGFTISAQDTNASDFTGATAGTPDQAGTAGLVIQPAAGDHNKFLRGNGTWSVMNAGTISVTEESGTGADEECFLLFTKEAGGANTGDTNTDEVVYTNSDIKIDAKTKSITASKFIVAGATSGLLKWDGTLDTNTYLQSGEAGTTYTFGVEAPTNSATDRENLKITAGGAGSGDQLIGFLAGSGLSIDLSTADATITYAGVDFTGATAGTPDQAGTAGLVIQPAAGDHNKFLKGDGTWAIPNTAFGGANGTDAGTAGLVIQPAATDNNKFLKGNGTWATPNSNFSGATSGTPDQAGTAGLVIAPAAGDHTKFLKGNGTWAIPNSNFTGATSGTPDQAGTAGLVIAPAAGDHTKFLKGDGTWATPNYTTNTNTTYALKCTKDSDGGATGTNTDPYLFLDASSGTDDAIQINGGTNCTVTRGGDGSLTIDATETSHSDVVVDGDFTSNGFMKTDGSGTYSVDTNTYLTSETSHSDVLVDGDFGSQGFMKRGATAGSYSVDTNSYSTTSHTHSYQDPLTFSTGISESSNSVTVDAAVVTSVTVSTTNATTVDTIALSSFRVAEYTIHIAHSSGIQAQKLLVMCNGTSGSDHHSEYGIMHSASLLGTFSTTTSGSNVLVQFNSVNSSTTVKFIKQIVV